MPRTLSRDGKSLLTWTDSDPDNDIVGYDVYMGLSGTTLTLYKGGIKDMFLNNVPVKSSTTYYWKVITTDSQGNTADTGVYQFTIQ